MGILNVTPDSFSDGGRYASPSKAVAKALQMEAEGADIVDIGGESTRPGAQPVSVRQELRRVIPVIERLSKRLKIPISIDTSKAVVARIALESGASLVNDVTALRDPDMGPVVAQAGVPVVLMHMRGTPRTMQVKPAYRRLIPEVLSEIKTAVRKAREAGISDQKILIDPGIGFGKRPGDNLRLLKEIPRFKALGFPVVMGPSRKSFIQSVLGLPVQDRLFGTAAAVTICASLGADIVRVHDVAVMSQVVKMADAVRFS
ncbi:MAG: dihydropteroate synthase [Candidatus Omnitrophica bacterium]|nr:dihydropteroate synthase [Candidatus Omnitrophota bacterium]